MVIYDMLIARFLLQDKLEKVTFFKKIFLLADFSIKVILEIPFFSLSNTNIRFAETNKLT